METKEGFKVVEVLSRKPPILLSCIISDRPSGVCYHKDKWTEPRDRCGPLAVFDTLPSAISFKEQIEKDSRVRGIDGKLYPLEVWKCEIEESKYGIMWHPLQVYYCASTDGDQDTRFIMGGMPLENTPPGTILADRVKLIERVE
jgi:hypothetical protein